MKDKKSLIQYLENGKIEDIEVPQELIDAVAKMWKDTKKSNIATGKGGVILFQLEVMKKFNPDVTQEELDKERQRLEDTLPEGLYRL